MPWAPTRSPLDHNMTLRAMMLTALAMVAFAANSLLCRMALTNTDIDAVSFTSIRLISGALLLLIIVRARHLQADSQSRGNWTSALALFIYAAGFSVAYTQLNTGMGALLLFGSVQATMILRGLVKGKWLNALQTVGFAMAVGGLIGLLLPGIAAPPKQPALLMMIAGIAWGVYSLRGKGAGNATAKTAGNFLRAALLAAIVSLVTLNSARLDANGVWLAIASGALASGLGYAIWYTALPMIKATTAATVQLSVPVIAAAAGIALLSEPLSLRLVIASAAILIGIAIVISKEETQAYVHPT